MGSEPTESRACLNLAACRPLMGYMPTRQEEICSPTAPGSPPGGSSLLPLARCMLPVFGSCMPTSQPADLSAVALSPASGALSPTRGCASGPAPAICKGREVPLHTQGHHCYSSRPAADHEGHTTSRPSEEGALHLFNSAVWPSMGPVQENMEARRSVQSADTAMPSCLEASKDRARPTSACSPLLMLRLVDAVL